MEFKKYNSIENSYQNDFIETIINHGFSNLEYIVQEKVHGANLSFICDGKTILSAKRTELILESENFYNSSNVLEKYKINIFSLHQELFETHNAKSITIFGELYGGGYPHNEVLVDENAKLIQRGIYYNPSNDFYAFDILINNEYYLNVDLMCELFAKYNFNYAKTIFKGNLKECLEFPNNFKTKIPNSLNLPEIDGNISEGTIIRTEKPEYLKNGSRVLIKNKNEIWSENNKYIDRAILTKIIRDEEEELSEEANFLCEEIYKYITENRLLNLISKIGEINPKKDLGKVLGLYCKDALEDFLKINKEKYDDLEKIESKRVNKFLNKQATVMITEYFK